MSGLRRLGDGAAPDVPVPPPGRAVDLPGRGTTHVLDLAGPTPDAPILLLMHGIATTGSLTWFSVLDDLRQRYRVVTFDQRWHGRGIRSENFTLDDCADDAVAVLDALGIERAVVVGYSMGGASAQVLWHRHPERVAGLGALLDRGALAGPPRRAGLLPDAADRQPRPAVGRGRQGAGARRQPAAARGGRSGGRAPRVVHGRAPSNQSVVVPGGHGRAGPVRRDVLDRRRRRTDRCPRHREGPRDPDRAAVAAGRSDPGRDHPGSAGRPRFPGVRPGELEAGLPRARRLRRGAGLRGRDHAALSR